MYTDIGKLRCVGVGSNFIVVWNEQGEDISGPIKAHRVDKNGMGCNWRIPTMFVRPTTRMVRECIVVEFSLDGCYWLPCLINRASAFSDGYLRSLVYFMKAKLRSDKGQ